jgi:spore coat polysaccharide biosynthesis protein SpsF
MILAILQARVSSTRLPGKVLKTIVGKPMVLHQLERLRRVRSFDKLVVATSTEESDLPLVELCRREKIECYAGSLDDVLDRFYQTAQKLNPDTIVRLTGDCPLTDPELIDEVIQFHMDGGYDHSSNSVEPTFPNGLDVSVFKYTCLEQAWNEATLPSDREHVDTFIWKQPGRFKIGHYKETEDRSHFRWTVDEPEDFELITRIYEALYPQNRNFTTDDILHLLDKNPDWIKINAQFERNEGYRKSLKNDKSEVLK